MLGLGNLLSRGKVLGFPNQFSFNFDGSNDYLDCGNPTGLQITGAFTISGWINTSNTGAVKMIASKDDDTNRNFHLSINASNYLSGGVFSSGTGYFTTGDVNICDGAWHHVAFTFVASTSVNVYVDGELDATNTSSIPATIDNDTVNFLIGRLGDGSYDFNGKIDEVAVFNTALSASDIAKIASKPLNLSLASAYATDRTSNLKLWLRAGDKGQPEKNPSITRSDYYTDFDGTNDVVTTPSIDLGTTHSVSCWVKTSTGSKVVVGIDSTNYAIYLNSNLQVNYDATGTAVGSADALISGAWNHVVVTRSGTTVNYYINGKVDSGGADTINANDALSGVFGLGGISSFYLLGQLSNVAFYKTQLDAQTIKQFAKSRFTPMRDNRFSVVDFDGSDDYITSSVSNFRNTDSSGGITAWVKLDSTGWMTIFSSRQASSNDYYVTLGIAGGTNGIFAASKNNDSASDVRGATDISGGSWHHVAVISDGSEYKLYVDGVLETLGTNTNNDGDWFADTTNTDVIRIGDNTGGTGYFNGDIASVAVYSSLSEDEVYAQYAKGITANHSSDTNLVGYWRMGSGTGDAYPTIKDQSTNSNNGTITNGAYNDIVQQMVAGYDMGAFDNSSLATNVDVLDFDGSGDYIDCGDLGTLSSGWTVSIWWANDQATAENSIWRQNSAENGVSVYNGTSVLFYYAATHTGTNIGSYTQGQWVHTVHTLNSDLVTMNTYSNGVDKDTDTLDVDSKNYTFDSFYIGNGGYGTWDGQIAQVAVYSSELTAEQVLTQYNLGIGGDYSSDSNLVGYWKMNTASTSSNAITDLSGNGNHGTVNGNPRLLSYYDDGVQLISPLSDTYPAIIDVNEPVLGAELVDAHTLSSYESHSNTIANITDGVSITHSASTSNLAFINDTKMTNGELTDGSLYKMTANVYYEGGSSAPTFTFHDNSTADTHTLTTTSTTYTRYLIEPSGASSYLTVASIVSGNVIYVQNVSVKKVSGNFGTMTNQAAGDLVYSSVLPDQSFLTGVNSAYNFIDLGGTDEYISVDSVISDIATQTGTINLWVMPTSDTGAESQLFTYNDNNARTDLLFRYDWDSDRLAIGIAQSGSQKWYAYTATNSADSDLNNWNMITLIHNGTEPKLYANGIELSLTFGTSTDKTFWLGDMSGVDKVSIGAWNYTSLNHAFIGKIGQSAVWNKNLSASEILAIYNLGRNGNLLDKYSDNLVGNWAMSALDASTGLSDVGNGTIYDRSGQSNHGTATNTEAADLASSPNADPNGYAKGDTIRDSSSKA